MIIFSLPIIIIIINNNNNNNICLKSNIQTSSVDCANKAGHSCETALLRVYNDIVTTIGRGNSALLVLLDLSAAFDTIVLYSWEICRNTWKCSETN